jgi:hypothetical protein
MKISMGVCCKKANYTLFIGFQKRLVTADTVNHVVKDQKINVLAS